MEKLMTVKFYLGVAVLVASSVLAGCGESSTNVSVNANRSTNAMTNMGTNNSSSNAVLVNSNSNIATNRWNDANVSREEYDKSRADYEKEKGVSTIGTGVNDSWLWFKTRAALLTTSDLRESTINVDVVNDVITLKGTVANAAQKAKAEQVANGIEGKKKVVNELKVAPNDSMTNMSGNANMEHSNANKK
ncbi:MAG: BON domain-containing protein [Acidobacteriota bacterium]